MSPQDPRDYNERPIDTTFRDVQPILLQEVNRYLKRQVGNLSGVGGVDREELLSVVYERYAEVTYSDHDPNRGNFLKRVRAVARYSIKDFFRSRQHKVKLPQEGPELSHLQARMEIQPFDREEFLRLLSGDARLLATVALETEEVERLDSHNAKRTKLVRIMEHKGWTFARISSAWKEVARALTKYAVERDLEVRKVCQKVQQKRK